MPHDIFISYSRADKEKVEKIAHALQQAGASVWWDPKIQTGSGFRNEITDALNSTKSVLVIWSRHSVNSRFVCDEADEGAARGILFPALIDNVDIPLGFRQIQTADLTHWRGKQNDPALKTFVKTVMSHIPDTGRRPTVPDERPVSDKKTPPQKRQTKKTKERKSNSYTTTGSKRRLALVFQSLFLSVLIATAFAGVAYTSDFIFPEFRPLFVAGMGLLAFMSRLGILAADRAAGAASLSLFPRSFLALILFSLISIAPLLMEGRLYAFALEGVQVKGIEGADINSVTIENTGKRVVTVSDDSTVRLWDAKTGILLNKHNGHKNWVWGADFSSDGKTIATVSRDLTVQLWQPGTLTPPRILKGHTASIYDVAFHPSQSIIATASGDKTVRLWDATSGEQLRSIHNHTDDVTAVDFSPLSNILLTSSRDGVIRGFDWETGQTKYSLSGGSAVNDVKFSKDGTKIGAAMENGSVAVWRMTGQKIAVLNHGSRAFAVAFINSDSELATSGVDDTIKIWNIANQNLTAEISGHRDGIRGLDSSGDGAVLASGSRDNTARIWNARTREQITIVGHIDSALTLPFALDIPPYFVTSQAPVPVEFSKNSSVASTLMIKGTIIAAILLSIALILKGVFWLLGLRSVSRACVVLVLFTSTTYLAALIASSLPVEALSLWATIAFVPAVIFAFLRWIWRSTLLNMINQKRKSIKR